MIEPEEHIEEVDDVGVEFTGVIPSLKGALTTHGSGDTARILIEFDLTKYPQVLAVFPDLLRHELYFRIERGLPVGDGDQPAVYI